MRKLTIIVNKNPDNTFWCRSEEDLNGTFLNAVGNTVADAKKDLAECYKEVKEMNDADGVETDAVEFEYKYDVQSFFEFFSFLNVNEIARRSGINPSLLRQYAAGSKKAGETIYNRLSECLSQITSELNAATF